MNRIDSVGEGRVGEWVFVVFWRRWEIDLGFEGFEVVSRILGRGIFMCKDMKDN